MSDDNLPTAHNHGRKFTSTFYGVSWHKSSQRWAVQIRHDGKRIHVGYYADELEAAKAYDQIALRLRGNTTRTNFDGNGNRLAPLVISSGRRGDEDDEDAGSKGGAGGEEGGASASAASLDVSNLSSTTAASGVSQDSTAITSLRSDTGGSTASGDAPMLQRSLSAGSSVSTGAALGTVPSTLSSPRKRMRIGSEGVNSSGASTCSTSDPLNDPIERAVAEALGEKYRRRDGTGAGTGLDGSSTGSEGEGEGDDGVPGSPGIRRSRRIAIKPNVKIGDVDAAAWSGAESVDSTTTGPRGTGTTSASASAPASPRPAVRRQRQYAVGAGPSRMSQYPPMSPSRGYGAVVGAPGPATVAKFLPNGSPGEAVAVSEAVAALALARRSKEDIESPEQQWWMRRNASQSYGEEEAAYYSAAVSRGGMPPRMGLPLGAAAAQHARAGALAFAGRRRRYDEMDHGEADDADDNGDDDDDMSMGHVSSTASARAGSAKSARTVVGSAAPPAPPSRFMFTPHNNARAAVGISAHLGCSTCGAAGPCACRVATRGADLPAAHGSSPNQTSPGISGELGDLLLQLRYSSRSDDPDSSPSKLQAMIQQAVVGMAASATAAAAAEAAPGEAEAALAAVAAAVQTAEHLSSSSTAPDATLTPPRSASAGLAGGLPLDHASPGGHTVILPPPATSSTASTASTDLSGSISVPSTAGYMSSDEHSNAGSSEGALSVVAGDSVRSLSEDEHEHEHEQDCDDTVERPQATSMRDVDHLTARPLPLVQV